VISILLIQMIINDIEVNGATQKEYAQMAGVAETTINRFINKKISLGFDSVLSIIKGKFPDYEEKIMMDYIPSQDNQNARLSLEYCMINRLPEIADQLIVKLNGSEYVANKEWARVYEVERMRNKKEISPNEVIERVHKIDAKSEDMKILSKILELYANFNLENFQFLHAIIGGLEQRIEDCKSGVMMRSFKLRLGQLVSNIYLLNNKVDKCRYYANMVIDNTDNAFFMATAYHTLGHSYLYENLEDCLSYFNRAINFYEYSKSQQQIKTVFRNMNFVKCYWNKENNSYNIDLQNKINVEELEFYDILEIAFFAIRNKDYKLAIEWLDSIELQGLTDRSKGFYYYYRALANDNDLDTYYKSVKYFNNSGDRFYLNLPLKELKILGERESILEAFTE
jgi:hypothetical protein